MITASALPRLFRCPAGVALPQAHPPPSEWAERGTAIHRYIETRDLAQVPDEHREVCELIDLDSLPPVAAEVAFAWDVESGTARELGRGLGRDYGLLRSTEIPGTVDGVAVADDRVLVCDWKTGYGWVPPAGKNEQLLFGALCAARVYGRDEAEVRIVRLREDGSHWVDRAELMPWDLDVFAYNLRKLREEVRTYEVRVRDGWVPTVREGEWCKYCPGRLACPAKTALVKLMAGGETLTTLPMSPEMAGDAWVRLKQARAMLTHVEGAVMAALDEFGELPLPGGTKLRRVQGEGNESLNGNVAFTEAVRLFDHTIANRITERTVTKKRIGEVLRHDFGREGAAKERELLDAIRVAGGASRKPTTKLEETDA